ncbi:unnamed protein product [Candidula unifasciata]|uniref:LITAF domain-containing protein n=1 Tax=Candidula unifasciata TaxID=100452 RepID=A0A8S3YY79_9EUPU|nr:unnamed protein product [Candidula unifasciata]
MTDRSPMVNPSAPPPPSYVQATPTATTSLNNPTVAGSNPGDAPPPYTPTPPSYSYSHILPESGQNYQRFETTANNQVEVVALCRVGPEPFQVLCPNCRQLVTTVTHPRAGTLTFLSAGLCFLFCFICTLVPFCIEDLQDVEHRCPNCNFHLGTYTRL